MIESDRIRISPPLFNQDQLRRRILLTLNMTKIVQHIWEAIRQENTEKLVPVFDNQFPIRSTGDMRTWYTGQALRMGQAVAHQLRCLRQHLGGQRSLHPGP